jgi:aspartate 1-decarboxylase
MLINVLKSKLHRVTVTDANINYIGSCEIGKNLLEAANIQPYEQINIYNVNNGERFTTYAIPSDIDSVISVNGSAARKVVIGDILIIASFGLISKGVEYSPDVVFVDGQNNIVSIE